MFISSSEHCQIGNTDPEIIQAKGHTEVVTLLLANVSDPDIPDFNGLKPLHYAARGNHHEIVKLLLAAGVSPLTGKTRDPGRRCGNARSSIGDSPLMYASQSGCTESIREMIPYLQPEKLNDALCWASSSGRTSAVQLILNTPGVSVDPPGHSSMPLFLASSGLHFEIMQLLLKKGADPHRRSSDWEHGRFRQMYLDTFENQQQGPTLFHAVCGAGRSRTGDEENIERCFRLLLDAGCDINAVDTSGQTPLHHAVCQSRRFSSSDSSCTLAALLLENGADVKAKDINGNTPLHLVELVQSSVQTYELLLENGANLDARRPSDGRTPVHTAVDSIHELDVTVLLSRLSDWNVTDSQGNTPLHIILSKSYHPQPTLGLLLKAGADPNRKNRNGETAIHCLRDGSAFTKDVLPLLLEAGADLEAKDNDGRTILMRVLNGQSHDHLKALNFLLDLGAKIDTRDNHGNGPLHTICGNYRSGPKLVSSTSFFEFVPSSPP